MTTAGSYFSHCHPAAVNIGGATRGSNCWRSNFSGNSTIMDLQGLGSSTSRSSRPPVFGSYAASGVQQQQHINMSHTNSNSSHHSHHSHPCCGNCNNRSSAEIRDLTELLVTLASAHKKSTDQIIASLEQIRNTVTRTEERLTKVEEAVSEGWNDVYEYRDSSHRDVGASSLFTRREQVTGMSDDSNDDNVRDCESAPAGTLSQADLSEEALDIAYPTSYGGQLHIDERVTDNVPPSADAVISSVPINRRQSNSASTTTIESGYAEDPIDSNIGAEQIAHSDRYGSTSTDSAYGHHEQVGESINHKSTTEKSKIRKVIKAASRGDDDIQILDEVKNVTPKSSQKLSNMNDTDRIRRHRPSVFSKSFAQNSKNTTIYFDDISDDENNATPTYSQGMRPSANLEISSINGIFEDIQKLPSDKNCNNNSQFSSQQSQRKRTSPKPAFAESNKKRICGISKAPIKQEPATTSSSFSTSYHLPHNTSVPDPASSSITTHLDLNLLKNIKKEKVPHAQESPEQDDNGYWRCICGHHCTTRSGIRAHVKMLGTEEPRYKCIYCHQRFIYPHHVRHHIMKHHNGTPSLQVYGCDKCYGIFLNREELNTHKNIRNEICKTSPRRSRSNHEDRAPPASEIPGVAAASNGPSIIIKLN